MTTEFLTIGSRPPSSAPAPSGCACCAPATGRTGSTEPTAVTAPATTPEETAMTTTTYSVTGMTCGHCVAAVTEEIEKLPGVQGVDVDLVKGGASRVTVASEAPLAEESVREAVDEAGYELSGSPS